MPTQCLVAYRKEHAWPEWSISSVVWRVAHWHSTWCSFAGAFSICCRFAERSLRLNSIIAWSWAHIAAEPLTRAERAVDYAIADFDFYRREFVIKIARQYYEVLQALDWRITLDQIIIICSKPLHGLPRLQAVVCLLPKWINSARCLPLQVASSGCTDSPRDRLDRLKESIGYQ